MPYRSLLVRRRWANTERRRVLGLLGVVLGGGRRFVLQVDGVYAL